MGNTDEDMLICPLFNLRIEELFAGDDQSHYRKVDQFRKGYSFSDDVSLRLSSIDELFFCMP